MAGERDAELIASMVRAWSGGDVEAVLEVFDPAVEVRPAMSTFLASPVYSGHQGVRSWYAETNEPWAELHAEPESFVYAGDRTLAIISLHARVPGGRVEVDARIAHVVTTRDGKIVRIDGYEEPDAALAALGLAEQSGACLAEQSGAC